MVSKDLWHGYNPPLISSDFGHVPSGNQKWQWMIIADFAALLPPFLGDVSIAKPVIAGGYLLGMVPLPRHDLRS